MRGMKRHALHAFVGRKQPPSKETWNRKFGADELTIFSPLSRLWSFPCFSSSWFVLPCAGSELAALLLSHDPRRSAWKESPSGLQQRTCQVFLALNVALDSLTVAHGSVLSHRGSRMYGARSCVDLINIENNLPIRLEVQVDSFSRVSNGDR